MNSDISATLNTINALRNTECLKQNEDILKIQMPVRVHEENKTVYT